MTTTGPDLVASFAGPRRPRSPPEDDTHTLAGLLINAGSDPVVLTTEEEAAYRRLTDQALAMFHLNDRSPAFSRGTDR